jgi:hypothetical protein
MTARKEKPDMQLAPLEGTVEESRAMTAPTPDNLLAMALSRGADMEQLERLMALKERHDANEARKAYVAALAAFKAEPIDLRKTKAVGYETTGGVVGYKHATLADVVDAVVTAMAKHGLSHNWSVKQDSGITVTCTLTHALGHSESVSMTAAPDNSGKKNAIQQVASTVTYLQRYTLQSITGVAAKDVEDDDGAAFDKGDGDDEAGGLAEATLVDWETAIGECENNAQLAGMRKEMIAKLGDGDIEKVPQRLRSAVLRRAEQLAKVE